MIAGLALAVRAYGYDIDAALLREVIADDRGLIEQVAGRKFDHVPPVEITTRAILTAELDSEWPTMLAERGVASDRVDHVIGWMKESIADHAGIYEGTVDRIYLLSDAFEDRHLASEVKDGEVKCTLVHELVHALQDQNLPGSDEEAYRVLEEGHATWVAEQVCAGLGLRPALGVSHLSIRAAGLFQAEPDEEVVRYGHGRAYMAHLAAEGGVEAQWAALASPPPVDEIIAVARASEPLPWPDIDAIADAMIAGAGPGWVVKDSAATRTWDLFGVGDVALAGYSRLRALRIRHASTPRVTSYAETLLWVAVFDSDEDAADVLAALRTAADHLAANDPIRIGVRHEAPDDHTHVPVPCDEAVMLHSKGTGAETNVWARRGPVVVGVDVRYSRHAHTYADAALRAAFVPMGGS
jgi:hypothetical protein